MTPEQARILSASLHRQTFLIAMLNAEYAHFHKTPAPSGIKQIISDAKRNYVSCYNQLQRVKLVGGGTLATNLKQSDEKIFSMLAIFEKLAVLDESELAELEKQFETLVTVSYK